MLDSLLQVCPLELTPELQALRNHLVVDNLMQAINRMRKLLQVDNEGSLGIFDDEGV